VDARRVARVPGTWNRKGPHSAERPHRMCRLVSAPEKVEEVPGEMLWRLAGQKKPLVGSGLKATAGDSRERNYALAALRNEAGKVAMAPDRNRNNQLNESAFNVGGFVATGLLSEGEVRSELTEAARRCGLDKDPNCGERGIEGTINSGIRAG